MIRILQGEYSVRLLCDLLSCWPSTYYYRPVERQGVELRATIEEIALEFPRYGYRRMTAELRRRGVMANHKRILRVMRETNLLVDVRRYVQTTFTHHGLDHYPNLIKGVVPEGPDHIWCGDITYIRVQSRPKSGYLALLMDIFTRGIRGWHLSRTLSEELSQRALERALSDHHPPQIHHSDQGIQYVALGYVDMLQAHQVAISMAEIGQPTQNAYVERLIRTLKEEEVYLHEYEDFDDAYERIARFLDQVYMTKRVHSALGYLPPAEFEANYWANHCLYSP